MDDPVKKGVWLFKPENRVDALKRITELRNISNNKRTNYTFEDHKRIGALYGYSEFDIDKYLSWKSFLTMIKYAMAERTDLAMLSIQL